MDAPSSQLIFEINEKSYPLVFPNNRQYIAIQNQKAVIASQYAELKYMGAESQFAEQLVDAIAHLSVLAPDLLNDLNKPILDLGLKEGRELVKAYTDSFRPWYNANLDYIFGVNKEDNNATTTTTTEEPE